MKPVLFVQDAVPIKKAFARAGAVVDVNFVKVDGIPVRYEPNATVASIDELLAVVDRDQYGCFWG